MWTPHCGAMFLCCTSWTDYEMQPNFYQLSPIETCKQTFSSRAFILAEILLWHVNEKRPNFHPVSPNETQHIIPSGYHTKLSWHRNEIWLLMKADLFLWRPNWIVIFVISFLPLASHTHQANKTWHLRKDISQPLWVFDTSTNQTPPGFIVISFFSPASSAQQANEFTKIYHSHFNDSTKETPLHIVDRWKASFVLYSSIKSDLTFTRG